MRFAMLVLCLSLCSADSFGQNLIWEKVEDISGGTDEARAITLSRRSAVVIGNASNPAQDVDDFVIQSLRRTNGLIRWADRVPEARSQLSPLQITSAKGRIYASGYAQGSAVGTTDIVVRGYDALTGALLWNSVWNAGQDDQPQAIAAGPAAVVVVGYGGNSPGHALNFIVRAYDPASGTVRWEDRVEQPDLDAAAWTVAITRNYVFVAGTTLTPAAPDLLVRAYDVSSGALAWQMTRPATTPTTIKAAARSVVIAGSSSGHDYIGALDARTGVVLWEDQTPRPGGFLDMAVEGNRVVATGNSRSALLLRSYDARTGAVEWEAPPAVPSGQTELGLSVALNGTTVYVGGSSGQDFFYAEMLIRAYDAATGAQLWDDRAHRSAGAAAVVDVALGKNRLFVAGYASEVNVDFVIRAYDVRNDGTDD